MVVERKQSMSGRDVEQANTSSANSVNESGLTRRAFLDRSAAIGASALAAASFPTHVFAAAGAELMPMSIREAGKRMRDGSLSCVELTKAYYHYIELYQPKL